jgi:hypothetical protein
VSEPFAEILEPRGEISLVARRAPMIAFISRAVSHAFDPRDEGVPPAPPPLKTARTILMRFARVKKVAVSCKLLI